MRRALLILLLLWPAAAAAQIPVLQVSPVSLAVIVDSQTPPALQQVRIRNLGSGLLQWTAVPSVAWIRVSPRSGSGPAVLAVEIDRTALAPGRHEGRITIDARDADDSPVSITVTVDVAAASPGARTAAPAGAAPAAAGPPAAEPRPPAKPEVLAGRGAPAGSASDAGATPGPLRIDRKVLPPATRNLPYSQVIPIAGGTPPYTIRLVDGRLPRGFVIAQGSISGTARTQGYYPFVISVMDASVPPLTITQSLAVRVIILQPDTALVVSPPSINLRLPGRGRDGHAQISIGSGRQRLEWTVTADVPWIHAVPPSGLSPAAVDIAVSAAGLKPGTYVGALSVTMEGAPNSPASIPVQVTVPR